jgi:hypothetical protein
VEDPKAKFSLAIDSGNLEVYFIFLSIFRLHLNNAWN